VRIILLILFIFNSKIVAACSLEEATHKRLILEKVSEKFFGGKADPNIPMSAKHMAIEIAEVGLVVASGDYKKACLAYDEIARKYNVNFKEHTNNTYTLSDWERIGKDKSGCAPADLHMVSMGMFEKINQKVARKELDFQVLDDYTTELSSYTKYVYSDIKLYCKKIKMLEKKYMDRYFRQSSSDPLR